MGNIWAAAIVAGALVFALVDGLAFHAGLYRPLLDPSSTAGAFEAAIARLLAVRADPRRDVLVLGDSRVYSGLDPAVATAAAGGRLRFLDGSVPGTTPRCWFFFDRAIDPKADRFRAVVIPVDTYGDDDSAIGSIDGDQRQMDLHYIVFQVGPRDVPKLAASFPDSRTRLNVGIDLLLRGPELRDDVQALAAEPAARLRAIAQARTADPYDPLAAHPRTERLTGLRVDFAHDRITYPPGVAPSERHEMEIAVLGVAHPSPSYARYRRRWLGPIVRRYAAAGVPVIFVRLPTRPAHRRGIPEALGASLRGFARADGARMLAAAPYLTLERSGLFADHDHLDALGSRAFSARLGRDVARVLDGAPAAMAQPAARRNAGDRPDRPSAPSGLLHAVRDALAIGVPLPFQSYEFAIFFALVAALFYAVAGRARRLVLLAASYYFYARWNAWYVIFLWILTGSDYAIAIALERAAPRGRKLGLALGIAANLAFLGTFKYANFASGTIAALVGMHENPWLVSLIVPIGISFHTFQSISYLVDVYRGKMRAVRDPFDYALYLAFFPQLLAGPIVRAGLFFSELFAWRKPNAADVGYGCMRVAFGLVKKVGIADQFAPASNAYFDSVATHPGALAALGAIFAFSMQIYFDFSGYSDIAIGCARLFGFVFPENFAQPYLAISITDFWHRWHITLSTWLRDYLYIPLGGSRRGLADTLRNLMLTMVLGGLWHGSQWTFVAWGGYHGVLLSLERLLRVGRPGDEPRGIVYLLRVAITFVAVSLGWVLFRAPGFGAAATVYHELFAGGWQGWPLHGWQAVLAAGIVAFAIGRIVATRLRLDLSWMALPFAIRAASLAALLLALELFSWPGAPATFIYFKF
ncbi:MAG TPA: MBOAT family protein [Candidatus Tumulicola sp.]